LSLPIQAARQPDFRTNQNVCFHAFYDTFRKTYEHPSPFAKAPLCKGGRGVKLFESGFVLQRNSSSSVDSGEPRGDLRGGKTESRTRHGRDEGRGTQEQGRAASGSRARSADGTRADGERDAGGRGAGRGPQAECGTQEQGRRPAGWSKGGAR